ncbi:MAG: hypothetical protein ABI290_10440, partial [Ginsengibacter sp.]
MKQNSTTSESSRRIFLKQMGLLGLAAAMPAALWQCTSNSTNYTSGGIAPYSVWEEMLIALQTSPDHLEGRMEFLIKQGAPEAMFLFVRDEIHLLPTTPGSLHGLGKTMRYGLRGALRYGFATPREKAELLHHMFSKASIPSSVVYERTDIQLVEVPSFFYRPFERKFEPVINKKIVKKWSKEMNAGQSKSEAID